MNSVSNTFPTPPDGTFLPVVESFYSIQGEGANTGKAAWFVRLGGGNVRRPRRDAPSTRGARRQSLRRVSSILT